MAAVSRGNIATDSYIDLTLLDSDDDDATNTFPSPLRLFQSFDKNTKFSPTTSNAFDTPTTSNHGLPLKKYLGRSVDTHTPPTSASLSPLSSDSEITPVARTKVPRPAFRTQARTQNGLPKSNSLPTLHNLAKRIRISQQSSEDDLHPQSTVSTEKHASQTTTQNSTRNTSHTPITSPDNDELQLLDDMVLTPDMMAGEMMNLASVLRTQILPFINLTLTQYERLDSTTKNQIRKKVAIEIGEDELRSLLFRGEKRLSTSVDRRISQRARDLVQKHVKSHTLANPSHHSTSMNLQRSKSKIVDLSGTEQTFDNLEVSNSQPEDGASHEAKRLTDLHTKMEMEDYDLDLRTFRGSLIAEIETQMLAVPFANRDISRTRETTVIDLDSSEHENEGNDIAESSTFEHVKRHSKDLTVPNGNSRMAKAAAGLIRNKDEFRMPRAPSSFIIYRKEKLKEAAKQNPGLSSWQLSPVISALWAREPSHVKAHYKGLSDDILRNILRNYPNGHFTRKSTGPGKRGPGKHAFNESADTRSDSDDENSVDLHDTPIDSPAASSPYPPLGRRPRKRHIRRNLPVSAGSSEPRIRQVNNRSVLTSNLARRRVEQLRLSGLHATTSRPFLSTQARADIKRGIQVAFSRRKTELSKEEIMQLNDSIIHVDFNAAETQSMGEIIQAIRGNTSGVNGTIAYASSDIERFMFRRSREIPGFLRALRGLDLLPGRREVDIAAFLQDAAAQSLNVRPEAIRLQAAGQNTTSARYSKDSEINATLLSREIGGHNRGGRDIQAPKIRLKNLLEDSISREAEWTDCSGDIATITWLPNEYFICGAITHSDAHNQQYNKPGNLLMGSVGNKSLNSVSGHQIPRPIVHKGQNSLASMRTTQDPWLYCSVSSTAYAPISKKCFTASYDTTVKIWDCDPNIPVLQLCGVWEHDGNVNFVVTSPYHDLVATAADVSRDAVRVYRYNNADVSASPFASYSGTRANEQVLFQEDTGEKWAYYPATIQWGKSTSVSHLLLVGYSPRSPDCEDGDIPDDKVNTGELCLWDVQTGTSIQVASARLQNVFEVVWHPTLPVFFAATSATGEHDFGVLTQVRLFTQTQEGTFIHTKTLDCPAIDINELTVMPNSLFKCYVTASCTDGRTYVWDTARDDKPIQVLCHGDSIDDSIHGANREVYDNGVKFAAWGRTVDRFYTGSSDGVVKAWNIRASSGQAFLHDIISLSGGISAGAFSPDFSKLIIGDATGKVHLLRTEDPGKGLQPSEVIRQPITPHAELPRPVDSQRVDMVTEPTAKELADGFLRRGEIVVHPDRYIGAVQGPNYANTGLFCKEKHINADPHSQAIGELQEVHDLRNSQNTVNVFPRLPKIGSSNSHNHEARGE